MIDNDHEFAVLLASAIPKRRQHVRRSPDLEGKVLALARLGIPLSTISNVIGVPPATISHSWRKSDPVFASAFAEAVAAGRQLNSDIAVARARAGELRLRSMLPRRAA